MLRFDRNNMPLKVNYIVERRGKYELGKCMVCWFLETPLHDLCQPLRQFNQS